MGASAASLFLLLFSILYITHSTLSLNQEGLYLLETKRSLDDPQGSLSNWNSSDPTPCNWIGVSCSPSSPLPTVTSLNFTGLNLAGSFPASLCRLPNLEFLSLSWNFINGSLSSSSLMPCLALKHLDLSQNVLVGPLPDALADMPSLRHLDLSFNNFSGRIPDSFGRFQQLEELWLESNLLYGTIPAFLGNISTLRELNLAFNPFIPGPIPPSLPNLTSLQVLFLAGCHLVGPIPPSLGQLSNLTNLDISTNALSGPIPDSLTSLLNLVQLELYTNSLSGSIPKGFSKLSRLQRIDMSSNHLEGPLPDDLFDAPKLESLHLYYNHLTGPIPAGIARSTSLVDIFLFSNRLNGSVPVDLGKNSALVILDLSSNSLSGSIPPGICDHGVLRELLLINNLFSGPIPKGLARCRSLTRVRLANNRLTGEVPDGLWGLPHVSLLELSGNFFSGSISPAISSAANLSNLLISDNQFTGPIPSEMGTLSKLYQFSAANNRLMGPLPASLCDLSQLAQLDLYNNSLSGQLLRGINSWFKLTELNLAHNCFTGGIPPELGSLPVLNYLDLSSNFLTGEIPRQLQNLHLDQFNVSDNQLSGPLPPLFATAAYRDSFLGNPGLCNDLPGLCPGSQVGSHNHKRMIWILCSVFILSAFVLISGVGLFCRRYKRFKNEKLKIENFSWRLIPFHKLSFSEYEIIDCLHEDNLIGVGGSGKVYKAVLRNGQTVAVKRLLGAHSDADGNFEAEVTTLGKIRHKNILKLWCCYVQKDCKLLVYEYMQNGSLWDVLHGCNGKLLDWHTRYNIALDAAEGLSYLHHDCVPPIVHRDVKSNNILLNAEFSACVADFGVAKSVPAIGLRTEPMSAIAGSCGYIAPEYAYTLRVNEKSDVYSFGVVILELLTGKQPVGSEDDINLVKWVSATVAEKGTDHVFDPKLGKEFREDMEKMLKIGLLCTSYIPINRPSMRWVVKMLKEVPGTDIISRLEKKNGTLLPHYQESSDLGCITLTRTNSNCSTEVNEFLFV
ncbi:Leucine-rich receptor-like protein kinase [Rhynchospora pubera]|uniref:non-specific serine/threonine protein kinase n=1 Tax=Rhynchospora pubera TaxID=906938 RepID=A0AAV8EM74_9POAL|nr:Leucine-rich receptor-like protein kinase [Rhynchospora pubera]